MVEQDARLTPQEQGILDRLDRSGDCWLWIGTPDRKGRGHVWHNGRMKLHHRAVWEILKGSIPNGAMLCHHCDNQACANPAHLYVGNHRSNTNDMIMRRRAWYQKDPAEAKRRGKTLGLHGPKSSGPSHVRAKLDCRQVRAIRGSTDRIIDLADRYRVSLSTIHRVRNGSSYGSVK